MMHSLDKSSMLKDSLDRVEPLSCTGRSPVRSEAEGTAAPQLGNSYAVHGDRELRPDHNMHE
jgi:hypothetical protein